VGKVRDLFAGVGVEHSYPAATNARGLAITTALLEEVQRGLIFTNLIETDQVYGHRKDADGFHRALQAIDTQLADWLTRLRTDDLLVITADHGIDPDSPGTDHTREYAPLLAVAGQAGAADLENAGRGAASSEAGRHDGPLADVGATALCWLTGQETDELPGQPFAR
jgi:phosphopentomutase